MAVDAISATDIICPAVSLFGRWGDLIGSSRKRLLRFAWHVKKAGNGQPYVLYFYNMFDVNKQEWDIKTEYFNR